MAELQPLQFEEELPALDFEPKSLDFNSDAAEPPVVEEAPFIAQVGRGMMDVYQGAKQLAFNMFGPEQGGWQSRTAADYNKEVAEEIEAYNKGNPDFQVGRLVGNLSTPLILIPGTAAKASAKTVLAAGAALGAAAGSTSPVESGDYWSEKGSQVAIGAGIGAAIPVGVGAAKAAWRWVDDLIKPLFKSGVKRDVGRFLSDYVGENKEMITKALTKAVNEGDDRPVGQIIADAAMEQGDDFGGMIVRLEKDLARESDAIKSVYARQSGTRRAVIDAIAGSEDDMTAAVANRTTNGTRNYNAAWKVKVDADDELSQILDNAYAGGAVKTATNIAEADGKKELTRILHNVKIGLDKQIEATGDKALDSAERKAADGVKKRLVNWIESKNPQYKLAREQYALDSMPINKMRVGQEIKNSFVTSLEKDSPSKLAEGLRQAPRTIKRATGDSRFQKLDQILDGDEIASLEKLSKDLIVDAKAKTMAAGSKSVLGQIDGEVSVSLPHILSRPIVITNHLLKSLGKDNTPEYKRVLIDMVKNPDKFLAIYGGAPDNIKTQHAIDIVQRMNIIAGAQLQAQEQ